MCVWWNIRVLKYGRSREGNVYCEHLCRIHQSSIVKGPVKKIFFILQHIKARQYCIRRITGSIKELVNYALPHLPNTIAHGDFLYSNCYNTKLLPAYIFLKLIYYYPFGTKNLPTLSKNIIVRKDFYITE